MTRIKNLTINGFKKQDVVVPLSGRDIFVGPNGVGKSSRLQALGTALLGYVPGAPGKRPADTFRLATDSKMTVGLDTGAFRFDRTFTQKVSNKRDGTRDVSVTQKITVSPSRGESTNTEAESRIYAEMGNFPVMLDFGQFLSMSDAERRVFFYGIAGIEDAWTKESIATKLQEKLLPAELQEVNADMYQVRSELITEALDEWRVGLNSEDGVKAMLEWAKAKQKHWNAEQKKATGAVQKLATLKNELDETDRHITENKAELDALQKELTSVVAELARQEEARSATVRRLQRMREIEFELQKLAAEPGVDEEQIKAQASALEAQLVPLDIVAKNEELNRQIEDQDNVVRKLDTQILEAQKQITIAQAASEGMQRAIKQASERGGLCVISSNIACPKDFSPFVGWAQETKEQHDAQIAELTDTIARLEQEKGMSKGVLDRLKKQQQDLLKSVSEHDKANATIRAQMKALSAQLEQARSKVQLRIQRTSDLQAELVRLQSEPGAAVAETEVLVKQQAGLTERIEEMKAKIEDQEKAKTTISNMKASMIDSKTAENRHSAAKYLAEELGPKGIQGQMLIGALDPIRDQVTENLRAMGVEHPFFFETESYTGQEVFRFGWIDEEERKVDFDALSTGQQMMVLIALLVTILDRANPSCKVLTIDNVDNLDAENFRRVLHGLDVFSDRLDNILLAGVVSGIEEIQGWTVHQVSVKGQPRREVAS